MNNGARVLVAISAAIIVGVLAMELGSIVAVGGWAVKNLLGYECAAAQCAAKKTEVSK